MLTTLNPNMFNAVNFFVNEFGRIDSRNSLIHEKEKKNIESYINILLKDKLIKTDENIMARKSVIKDKDNNPLIVLYFVTGVSVDIYSENIDFGSSATGIIKMIATGADTFIILEDLYYSILNCPYSYVNYKIEDSFTPEEEKRIYIQNCVLHNFVYFINYVGIKFNWIYNHSNDKDSLIGFISANTDNMYPVSINDESFIEINISTTYCMFVEMLRRILDVLHNHHSDKEFNDNILIPFIYTLSVTMLPEELGKEKILEYAKLCIDVGKRIGEFSDSNYYQDYHGYSLGMIQIYDYIREEAFKRLINKKKEQSND